MRHSVIAGGLAALLAFAVMAGSVQQFASAQDLPAASFADDQVVVSSDAPVPINQASSALTDSELTVDEPTEKVKPRSIRAQVAKDKAAARQALADPQRAATEYFARLDADAAGLLASGEKLPYHLSVLQPGALQAQGADAGPTAAISARRQIYLDNLKRVGDLNAKSGPMLAYGITPFMHLTPEEWRHNYLGGRKNPVAGSSGSPGLRLTGSIAVRNFKGTRYEYDYICAKAVDWKSSGMTNNPLPASIDWRTSNVITAVKNQGNCGSCVAFADFAVLEASYIQKWKGSGFTNKNTDLSEQESMECMAADQCEGSDGYEYIDRSICKGVAQEKASAATKYQAYDNDKCPAVTRTASGVKAYTFVDADITSLRRALYHNPVAIGIAADDPFMFYTTGVIGCRAGDPWGLNHETTVVAYTQTSSSKFFTVKNSWGTGWGLQGYYNIRADCSGAGALSMYTDPYLTLAIRG